MTIHYYVGQIVHLLLPSISYAPLSQITFRKMNQDQIAYIIKDVLHALIYLQVIFNCFTVTPFINIK